MIALLLFYCAPQDSIEENDTSTEPVPSSEIEEYEGSFSPIQVDAIQESIGTGTLLSSIHSHTQLYSSLGKVFLRQEPEEADFLVNGSNVCIHSFQDSMLMAIDGTLYIEETEQWEVSPLSESNGHTTQELYSIQDTLFLFGAGQLFSWQNGTTRQISIPEQTILDIAIQNNNILLRTPALYSYNIESKSLSVLWEEPVSSLAVDGESHVWFSQDNTLYSQSSQGTLVSYTLPSTIIEIAANTKGRGIWIQTHEAHYFYRDTHFFDVGWTEHTWLDVDEHDRLSVSDGTQITRISIDRPTVIQGLNKNEAITTKQNLRLLPSAPDSVESVQVFISGTELIVEEQNWTFALNPDDFSTGLHNIHIVQHTSEDTHMAIHPFINQELPSVQWEEDIAPLHEEYCASCHGGATETALTSKEEWQQNIHLIIDVVSDERMPLGAPPLSQEQITTIRAWKQGDFQ